MLDGDRQFLSARHDAFVIILGANEIASATAVRLAEESCRIVLSHDPYPPVIRRGMAFYDALYEDRAVVDGVVGRRASTTLEILDALSGDGRVAVSDLQLSDLITLRTPDAVIDARMQKHRVTPDLRGVARLAIGLGPNFTARGNCDIAIETHPTRTGEIVSSGATRQSDGEPRRLGGLGGERLVYSARAGVWRTPLDIGARVFKGMAIGRLDGLPVTAPMDGRLRGVARDGVTMPNGVKLVEIDPRGRKSSWTGTDERGRAIAEGVAKAIKDAQAARNAMLALTV